MRRRAFSHISLQVCSSCYIKLRLPLENLREVAVASLISQLTPLEGQQDGDSFLRSSLDRISLRRSEWNQLDTSWRLTLIATILLAIFYRNLQAFVLVGYVMVFVADPPLIKERHQLPSHLQSQPPQPTGREY